MEKLFLYIKLIRPVNIIITFLSVALGVLISDSTPQKWVLYLAGFAGMCIGASGNIFNDIVDVEIDRINKPLKPLPSGMIKEKQAWLLFFAMTLTGLSSCLFLGSPVFMLGTASLILLLFYSLYFKMHGLIIGNIIVSLVSALALIFGGLCAGSVSGTLFPALFAFLFHFAREIIKDIEDIEGDRALGATTYPIVYGRYKALSLSIYVYLILIVLTFIPYLLNFYNLTYLKLIFVVNGVLIFVILSLDRNMSKKNLKIMSNVLKADMVVGILAIYFGR